jgi:hypothetical protein
MVKVSKCNKKVAGSNPAGATFIWDLSFDTLINDIEGSIKWIKTREKQNKIQGIRRVPRQTGLTGFLGV